jgi:dipeptidyl aminopeptidase/acylaminoacyl peptidase
VPWTADGLERLTRFDPARHADGFSTPLLVIHGANDFRVPATQALELYGLLRAKGVEARLVHYPDENHWILKPRNSLHWYGEFLGWLARHLGAQSRVAAAQPNAGGSAPRSAAGVTLDALVSPGPP